MNTRKKAGTLRVAFTLFCALFAIGRRRTWTEGQPAISMAQVVIGAAFGLVVIVATLVAIVAGVTR